MLINLTPKASRCAPLPGCPAVFINLTPEEFKCPPFPGCPAVFVKKELNDITPDAYRCIVGACSAVFSKDAIVYLVGKRVERIGGFAEIPVSADEELIAMPLGLLAGVKFPKVGD